MEVVILIQKQRISRSIKRVQGNGGLFLIILLCLLLSACGSIQAEENQDLSETVRVELFYNSPCESCKENEKFDKVIREKVKEENPEKKVSCIAYNVFRESDREYMEKRMTELKLSSDTVKLPFALIDGKLYQGSYDEIGDQIKDSIGANSDIRSLIRDTESTDSVILLFTTYSCDNCDEVKDYLENSLEKEYTIQQEKDLITTKVKLVEGNILQPENLELLNQLFKQYEVPSDMQKVPILFYTKGYLSGKKAITEGLQEKIEDGSAMGFRLKEAEEAGKRELLDTGNIWKIALTGLINGLNPCAASMLLMVLSLLLMSEQNFLKGSLSYLTGKLIAYLSMGMGVFWIFTVIEESYFSKLGRVISNCFAVLALLLFVLNLIDYINVRKKNYGKVIVQLPKKLRHFNHSLIHRIEKIPVKYLWFSLLILGIIISAGEFFCTGQLYAATILYMSKHNQGIQVEVFWMLLVYVSAMCIPQLIMILVINKSRNLLAVSRASLKGMPVIKLIYAVVFLLLFLLFLFI
jgi:glutaredoxin